MMSVNLFNLKFGDPFQQDVCQWMPVIGVAQPGVLQVSESLSWTGTAHSSRPSSSPGRPGPHRIMINQRELLMYPELPTVTEMSYRLVDRDRR